MKFIDKNIRRLMNAKDLALHSRGRAGSFLIKDKQLSKLFVFFFLVGILICPGTAASFSSDDFYSTVLDTGLWTLVDPVGDATVSMSGTQALLSVPSGTSHDVWSSGNFAPRIMQSAGDTDFEIEVKFESGVGEQYQLQGLLVEASPGNFLRFDFYSDGSSTRLFAASFTNGIPSVKKNSSILPKSVAPLYLRVTREGDQWTSAYSEDGINWATHTTFSYSLSVTSVGVFVGNAGASPAHTAVVDYFFNTASPINPEDGGGTGTGPVEYTLDTSASGAGLITIEPDQTAYTSGQSVTLTAVPDVGYNFSGWSGALVGVENPVTIAMDADKTIVATFEESTVVQYSVNVTSNGSGSVSLNPPGGAYDQGTVVTLTPTAAAGWMFDGWSGDLSGYENPTTINVTSDFNISANFSEIPTPQYELTVSTTGSGSVSLDPTGGIYDEDTVVTVTATPDSGSLFSGWGGDLDGQGNPAVITMTQAASAIAIFALDAIAPVISDVEVTVGLNSALIGWTTDEPAESSVSYGETSSYELGAVVDTSYTTNHQLIITGLDEQTPYHFQISAQDAYGNTNDSIDYTFTTTSDPSGIVSEDFSATTLNTGLWTLADPAGDATVSMSGTQALLSVPSGTSHDVWTSGNFAPRIMQPAGDTDFEIEVKFESGVGEPYQLQGLLVEASPGNFLRFDFYSDGSSTRLFAASFTNGSPSVKKNSSILPSSVVPLYMRVTREGDQWTQSYSEDGITWTTHTSFSFGMAVASVGVFAGNAGASPAHTAVVDYFFNTASPIVPEDGDGTGPVEYTLDTSVSGAGLITIEPDQTAYSNGQSVTLTAVPDVGYNFSGWSGALVGVENPVTIAMDADKTIVATFEESTVVQYSVNVTSNGSGSVSLNPPGGAYDQGTVVTLTPTAAAGWMFDGWSGDLSGYENPTTINVTSDFNISANFSEIPTPQYELTVSTTGSGSVSLDPTGGIYDEDTVVTVTATPDSGSLFSGWGGDLDGQGNPAVITMTQAASAIAIFALDAIAPVISDVEVTVGLNSALIGWTTDEPAESSVSYGETSSYELGAVVDTSYTTNHQLIITGLDEQTPYHFQISAQDAYGNTNDSIDYTFTTTSDPSGIVSEDFSATTLNTGLWTLADPAGDATVSMSGTQALLSVPSGTSHDVWSSGNFAPRIMQSAGDTDFEIEVKFESGVGEQYQLQGLLVEASPGNFLRFDFYSDGSSTRLFAASFANGSPSVKKSSSILPGSVAPLYLRVTREGDQWTSAYSEDGINWATHTTFSYSLSVTSVGVFVGNAGASPAHTAVVDYFFNTASPINPEDGGGTGTGPVEYTLDTSASGAGLITIEPDQTAYTSGQSVTLTAVPDVGYNFSGWSGALVGVENPVTIAMDADKTIVATFEESTVVQYSVNVTSNGSGSVSLNPPGGAYDQGTVVTLTATAAAGWMFDGWSGDLSGYENPTTINVTSDFNISANFSEIPTPQYELTVSTTGSGSVSLDPTGGIYDEDTVVTVTATPDSGSLFSGWGGDLDGQGNPAVITMTQAASAVAIFELDTIAPVISDVEVTVGLNSALIGWTTDEPADSLVSYGETNSYELGAVEDTSDTTNHQLIITGLDEQMPYHFQISTKDAYGNRNDSIDYTFTTTSDPSGIVSDDFSTSLLNTGIWTLVDPVGDATVSMNGTQALLTVPSGASHDVWSSGNFAPRIMQSAPDSDFEIEIKFESRVSEKYQLQGLLVEADENNFLRFDFYSDGSSTRLFAASFSDGSPSVKKNISIGANIEPLFMRITRQGDYWTQSYSSDGMNWLPGAVFSRSMVVSSVGFFAGNAGGSPAHTAVIDYFFNTASPVVPEDGETMYSVDININGGGNVTKSPDQDTFPFGDVVELTAVETSGWIFDSWGGDLSELENPITVTVTEDMVIEANFTEIPTVQYDLTVTTIGSGSVTLNPPGGIYNEGTVVELTAVAETGSEFIGWSDDLGGVENPAIIVIQNDTNISATFSSNPIIDVWYGLHQNFGRIGIPQRFINILGNVNDQDGIYSLTYSLNGGFEASLGIGPNDSRLENEGDFNIDLKIEDLLSGLNIVAITAVDNYNNQTTIEVEVEYNTGNNWPEIYSIDWNSVTNINDVAQIVDGNWRIESNAVRTVEAGYDRLIAIGDMAWDDFEVTVRVKIHEFANNGSWGKGVGLIMRWDGHHEWDSTQPSTGWYPLGALGWYRVYDISGLRIEDGRGLNADDQSGFNMLTNIWYIYKMRVETISNGDSVGAVYSIKVWEEGTAEPTDWQLVTEEAISDLRNGSLVLLAHNADVSFGNVSIVPVID